MTWRGSKTALDRIFSSLPYLLPLMSSLGFGLALFQQLPMLGSILLLLLSPVIGLYRAIPFASLIVFFALYLLVVRNESIQHFIRFNTMQALLIDIALFLCGLLLSLVQPLLPFPLLVDTLNNLVFLAALASIGYSVIQSLLGRYAEIPTLSEAVYLQVR